MPDRGQRWRKRVKSWPHKVKIIHNRFTFVYSEMLPRTLALSYEAKHTDLEKARFVSQLTEFQYDVLLCHMLKRCCGEM